MRLSIVIPCYNEQAVLPETLGRLATFVQELIARGKIAATSEAILVDDGSSDATWDRITEAASRVEFIRGLKLSRNRGHQTALLAGLMAAEGDAVISIDADLQDDLRAIEAMVDARRGGADVVYGVRRRRETDSVFKRSSAEAYYRVLALLGVEVVFNHADYRLLSRRAVEALMQYGERNLFLRGIIPQLGFTTAVVYYDRAERFAGESKYPLRKMLAFAWEGVTSFSAAPLRAITFLGIAISLLSFVVTGWALWIRVLSDEAVPGWASTVIPMSFLGGVQLLCLGVIGEYLAKIYVEVKRRPTHFIAEAVAHPSRTPEAAPTPSNAARPVSTRPAAPSPRVVQPGQETADMPLVDQTPR